jgi:hypothetical protein
MNRADPTTAETNFLSATDREFSVDEVAEIQALDATMARTESSILGVESSETQTKELEPKLQKLSIPSPLARRAVSGLYRSGGMGCKTALLLPVLESRLIFPAGPFGYGRKGVFRRFSGTLSRLCLNHGQPFPYPS